MKWNNHSDYENRHAFLSPSNYHWLNYDDAKLKHAWHNRLAKDRGTKLHKFAADAITYRIPLAENGDTISMYVNDCITDALSPEVMLWYSPRAFGTADGIGFYNDILRIYDLKTGVTPAKMEQLEIYASLFCLEYAVNPLDILVHCRIYQQGVVTAHEPTPDRLWSIIDRIIYDDQLIQSWEGERLDIR